MEKRAEEGWTKFFSEPNPVDEGFYGFLLLLQMLEVSIE
jgi:hypothetical protein